MGRRDALLFSCIFWLVGTALQTATTGRGMLIGGRILNGITVGITSSQVPVYLAEVAKHSQRGTIIIIQQLAIEWGILIMYFIGYGCSYIEEDGSFRTAWSMQFVPCVFFMIGLPFLPESPRWLAMKDRTEEAICVLANIQAGGDLNDPYVVAQYEEIITVLAAERAALQGWRKFVYNGMWRRTLAGFSVQAWQQLSGANVMTYYVVYIFYMADLSGNVNLLAGGVQYALFIIFSSIMFFFVDKIGRRTLLIYGALAMAFCHFVVGGILGAHGVDVPEGINGDQNILIRVTGPPAHTVIAFSYLLIIIYALTLAPICWIYAAEVWSLETRATGMGIAAIGNWLVSHKALLVAFTTLTWTSSTLLSAFSFLQPSAILNSVSSSFLDPFAYWLRFNSGLPIRKLAARPLRKSKFSLATRVLAPGRLERAPSALMRRLTLLLMPKQRMRPVKALSK